MIYSQSSSTTLSFQAGNNLKFVRYSVGIGLSSNAQRCIVQDKEGFIWNGTDDGLNRFDGYKFKAYRKNRNDLSSLGSNMINCLFTDSKGSLWVGTNAGGLSRYDKEKDNFYTYSANLNDTTSLLNNDINAIIEDKFNRLWIGTSAGLHLFDPQKNGFIRYASALSANPDSKTIAHNHIKRITVDGEILWIAYTTGILSALNTSDISFKHYELFDVSSWHTADFSVNSLVLDNNNIWISNWSKGIWIFDKLKEKCYPYEKEKSNYINFIFKDNKGKIWYSPEHKGLILIDGDEYSSYQFDDYDNYRVSSNKDWIFKKNAGPKQSLADLFQDRQGNLWVASKQGDLNYAILDNPFNSLYKNPNSIFALTNNLVTAISKGLKINTILKISDCLVLL